MIRRCLSFILFLVELANPNLLLAQNEPSVHGQQGVYIEDISDIAGKNGELRQVKIKVVNATDQDFAGALLIEKNDGIDFLGKSDKAVLVPAKSSLFFPVNIVIPEDAQADHTYSFKAKLQDSAKAIISERNIYIKIPEFRDVELNIPQERLMMRPEDSQLKFVLHVQNKGNSRQEVIVAVKLPEKPDQPRMMKLQFPLQPFSDTLIDMRQPINTYMFHSDEFYIFVTGMYGNGDFFGREGVKVSVVKTRRRFAQDDASYLYSYDNILDIRSSNLGGRDGIYNGTLRTKMKLSDSSRIGVNLQGTYYEFNHQLNIRNSWIDFENRRFNARLGNIYENYEVSLVGRGAEMEYKLNDKQSIQAGGLSKSDRLFYPPFEKGTSFWLALGSDELQSNGFQSRLIYDESKTNNFRNILLSVSKNIINNKGIRLDGGVSGGNTVDYAKNNASRYGFSAHLNFVRNAENWTVTSRNFFSTAYYPGQLRGALNLDERISYISPDKKVNLWGNYTRYSYRPKYVGSMLTTINQFSMDRVELGVSRKWNKWNFTFSPQFGVEKQNFSFSGFSSPSDELISYRAKARGQYADYAAQKIYYVSLEGGAGQTESTITPYGQFLSEAGFQIKGIGIDAQYQKGAFYIGESKLGVSDPGQFYRWRISPNITNTFFSGDLKVNLGLSYSYTSQSAYNLSAFGNLEYHILPDLLVTGGLDYFDYSYSRINTNRVSLGITKKFRGLDLSTAKKSLKLLVYYDLDGDGVFNHGDRPAIGQEVFIGGKAFITDAHGMIKYKGLPKDSYTIDFSHFAEWWAPSTTVYLKRNMHLSIGLKKMAVIEGTVKYASEKYSYELSRKFLANLITATDDKGVAFKSVVDSEGKYRLFVPKGNYIVSISTDHRPEHIKILNNNQTVRVVEDHPTTVDFDIQILSPKVIYKKFSSD